MSEVASPGRRRTSGVAQVTTYFGCVSVMTSFSLLAPGEHGEQV